MPLLRKADLYPSSPLLDTDRSGPILRRPSPGRCPGLTNCRPFRAQSRRHSTGRRPSAPTGQPFISPGQRPGRFALPTSYTARCPAPQNLGHAQFTRRGFIGPTDRHAAADPNLLHALRSPGLRCITSVLILRAIRDTSRVLPRPLVTRPAAPAPPSRTTDEEYKSPEMVILFQPGRERALPSGRPRLPGTFLDKTLRLGVKSRPAWFPGSGEDVHPILRTRR
jgi:hypothetical protein